MRITVWTCRAQPLGSNRKGRWDLYNQCPDLDRLCSHFLWCWSRYPSQWICPSAQLSQRLYRARELSWYPFLIWIPSQRVTLAKEQFLQALQSRRASFPCCPIADYRLQSCPIQKHCHRFLAAQEYILLLTLARGQASSPAQLLSTTSAPHSQGGWTATWAVLGPSLCYLPVTDLSLKSHSLVEHSKRPCSFVEHILWLCPSREPSQWPCPIKEHILWPHLTREPEQRYLKRN